MLFGLKHLIAYVPVKHAYDRYRLALDVFDNTAKAVFILFDEPAIQLVKNTASSFKLMDHDVSMKHF
jgi:hypothetical protein